MVKKIDQLSVFFPTYNEERNIEKVTISTKKILQKIAKDWEIIIVEDGSKDNTLKVSRKVASTDRRIRVVRHKRNRGYGGALKSGYKAAKYPWVAFTDSDGQFDFSEITKFLRLTQKADVIVGIRSNRADSALRKLFTFVWSKWLPRLLFNLKVTDYSCGFKLIKKEVFDAVQPLVGEEKVTQIEMLVKAQKLGYHFAEVPVSHHPRLYGSQTGADIKVVTRSVVDLVKLWLQLK